MALFECSILKLGLFKSAVLEIDLFAGELALMENGGRTYGVVASRYTVTVGQFEVRAAEGDAAVILGRLSHILNLGHWILKRTPILWLWMATR